MAPAVWSHTGLPPVPLRRALVRDPRDPQGKFATQALLRTDPAATPARILARFVQRRQLGIPFEEARRHLGVETPRQGAGPTVCRATTSRVGRVPLGTLLAHRRLAAPTAMARRTAWYQATPSLR